MNTNTSTSAISLPTTGTGTMLAICSCNAVEITPDTTTSPRYIASVPAPPRRRNTKLCSSMNCTHSATSRPITFDHTRSPEAAIAVANTARSAISVMTLAML